MTIEQARQIIEDCNDEVIELSNAYEAALRAFDALETIRAEVAEIEAAARMREDTEVIFTAGIIAGVVKREIAKVEGKT